MMTNSIEFKNTFSYKLIYIFSIDDEAHKDRLKIGDTTIHTDKTPDQLPPNCHDLNASAKERIDSYTKTADVKYNLLHTELAIYTSNKNGKPQLEYFRDYDVHKILENSGIPKKSMGNASEWFEVNLDTAIKAIKAKKANENNLSGTATIEGYTPIVFRPEQEAAIEQTVNRFKKQDRMLWNAKMRFGKTLTALEVIKREQFKKSIIITHRPVVDKGWYEDFNKIFYDKDNYKYGSKKSGYSLKKLLSSGKNFVYFASIQDLRGSKTVGGTFDKNDEIFSLDWDFVIIDEAHEGTQTFLGQNVKEAIIKKGTKLLELSGTPFNIMDQYDDSDIYTWDYVMEQKAKYQWDSTHCGDSNPYEELPNMHIYTYDLGQMLNSNQYIDIEDKAFNFKEFFRTWTGDIEQDYRRMPSDKEVGDFVHEEDIISFLNLITRENENNNYPFASEEYRNLFKHSFWLLPGVSEAKAFSKLLKQHAVFSAFNIVNVAGDGDDEDPNDEALNKVRKAIDDAGEDGYTITLSCGKLTTGVTVKEWTSVMYLSGSYSVSAANYLQTIFRAQSPCNKFGKMKTDCYVFDFAPDRTLKVVADAVQLSTKAGKSTDQQKYALGQFLNYCPVISIDNTGMKEYNVSKMLQQLKRAYADKAVRNGFEDNSLYNDNLMSLNDMDLSEFEELKKAVGSSRAQATPRSIVINEQGFTNEEIEKIEQIQKKPKKKRTPEEEAELKRLKELRKQKRSAISTLRAISIRMPLLIFGADIPINQDFKLRYFLDENIVDQKSWEEFMPTGVSRDLFEKFIKYYDEDVFIAAGNKIRQTVKYADTLPIEERIMKITELHSYFKNPDKETVLTPWRVVNMHMSDCLGGWCFFNEDFTQVLESPEDIRFVDNGEVTYNVFNKNSQILEINSKTGLYPLYVTYSVYRQKINRLDKTLSPEEQWNVWIETVENNIFVICKTPMAKAITKRTLIGFKDGKVNSHYFKNMTNQFQNKSSHVLNKILKESYWNKGSGKMNFNAIVGNPPYQEMDKGAKNSAKPLYHIFIEQSKRLQPDYLSMISPARWYAGGKGLDAFRAEMLNDERIAKLVDFADTKDCFTGVNIAGGVFYFLWDSKHEGECEVSNFSNNKIQSTVSRSLNEFKFFVRNNTALSIIKKCEKFNEETMEDMVSSRNMFGIATTTKGEDEPFENSIEALTSKGTIYLSPDEITDKGKYLDKYKVIITYAMSGGNKPNKNGQYKITSSTQVLKPNQACSETYLCIGRFDNEKEAENLKSYISTKTFRFLLLQALTSIHITKDKFCFIPKQDFSKHWTDQDLYKKYEFNDDEIKFIEDLITPAD